MKKLLFFSVILMMLMACGTTNKVSKEMKERESLERAAGIKALLESQKFFVMVGSMRPLSAPTISLSQGQKMIVREGTVSCYLPYAGSGQNVGYGASGFKSLNFTSQILNYKVEYPKKDRARVTFTVNNEDDSYKFNLEIFMNGKTTIDVVPRGREPISYSGMIHGLEML